MPLEFNDNESMDDVSPTSVVPVLRTTSGTPIRFSVCIPNYNYARYIGATIESVLRQTYPHFEIIVADNASTDNSVEVVKSFDDSRIRLIVNNYNIGFAPNLDRATESAKHEFMILLSSDDLMLPEALETYAEVLARLANSDACVLTSAVDQIDSEGHLTGISVRPANALFYQAVDPSEYQESKAPTEELTIHSGKDALSNSLREKQTPAHFLATCYSRSLYTKVEGYHSCYRMFPDDHFLAKLLAHDADLVYVPARLFAYRLHTSNQYSLEVSSGALKYQVDAYLRTVEFPQAVLDKIGVTRDDLVSVFIRKAVMERGLQILASGSWTRAGKCLAFGFATYPWQTVCEPRTYALAALLCLGPLAKVVARRLYTLRKNALRKNRT